MFANIVVVCATLLVSSLLYCVYNLTLHPLARFPGPLLFRATRLASALRWINGRLPLDMLKLHEQYGDIVRIAPNELAFAHEDAWREICGHRPQGSIGPEELPKWTRFYRNVGMPPSLISEDRDNHALLRRLMAPGFSDRAMREQEPVIGGYISLLIHQLRANSVVRPIDSIGKEGEKRPDVEIGAPKPVDMTAWFNWTTFDVIGDLAFGEPFGCLERGIYDPFVAQLTASGKLSVFIAAFKPWGLDLLIVPLLRYLVVRRQPVNKATTEKLQRRMALKEERADLIGGLLKKQKDWNLDFLRIRSNAGLLVVAGAETTATLLSGVTYLLLKNPKALSKLTDEVRSTFKSEDEITLFSVSKLHYMLACLDEAMRCYPPVPIGFPRQVPKGGIMIAGEFIPESTACAVWQYALYHSEKNFRLPFEYHPERFLQDPAFASDKLDILQPFSFGPRNCIGRNLAYAEMRLILARIIFNFDMRLADESKDWLDQNVYVFWEKPSLPVFLTPAKRG
ncbi:putative cytochrome P450 monooxygenase [Thozetella sp. PMI_491]|nr:putative cytochrome P450 monooxygenase [Thozetella sp. PMI_491]